MRSSSNKEVIMATEQEVERISKVELKEARRLAISVISEYCGPVIPLTALRRILDRQLGNISLSELIIKDRESL